MSQSKAKPFLKWAGGKRSVLKQYAPYLPTHIKGRYIEPFVGGGAVFFSLQPTKAVLADMNADLITTYSVIKSDPLRLISVLLSHQKTKPHFYQVRSWDRPNKKGERKIENLSDVERAARFIMLNKLSFNGLVRYNKSGQLNAPFGDYKKPTICNPAAILAASEALQGATITLADFKDTALTSQIGDFLFLDPPYDPLTKTSNFTAYTEGGFGDNDQTELAELFIDLGRRGIPAMLSNSNTPFIKSLYDNDCTIVDIQARRNVNRNAAGRGKISELLILNAAHTTQN